MITKNELQEYCVLNGLNLWQAERDYLQHIFLIFLSRHLSNELVFKGGTALQKAYGLNRFSIDLDFTQKEDIDITALIEKIVAAITAFGYKSGYEEIKTAGRTFKIKVQGPLYINTLTSVATLNIEISQRENLLLTPKIANITPVYRDLQPYSLSVMHEEEIMAEKIRAVISRNKPKDVFDLNFLLNKGIKLDTKLINKKMEYYKQKFSKRMLIENIKKKESVWEKEMKNYLFNVPDFRMLLSQIEEKLKGL